MEVPAQARHLRARRGRVSEACNTRRRSRHEVRGSGPQGQEGTPAESKGRESRTTRRRGFLFVRHRSDRLVDSVLKVESLHG